MKFCSLRDPLDHTSFLYQQAGLYLDLDTFCQNQNSIIKAFDCVDLEQSLIDNKVFCVLKPEIKLA